MSSTSANSSTSSGEPGRSDSIQDETKVESELVRQGNLVGEVSLEWSLNFLTRNCSFLSERSMSPLSIYAVHVWTGSQSCEFTSRLSFQGKIRNTLFKLLIHPVHELVNKLKTNSLYIAAASCEKPVSLGQSVSTHGLEIPLISGRCFDGDFLLNQMKWVSRLFQRGERGAGELSSEFAEDEECFVNIDFPDSLVEFSRPFCSKVVFHWLTHHILMNFLYNPNGPVSLLSLNILIEKLSPFFSKNSDCSKTMYSDILAFSESIWEVWRNIKGKNSNCLFSVANSLEKHTSDTEAFLKCLTDVLLKHPLDELLDNLSEFVIAINDALPSSSMHAGFPTPARANTSFLDGWQRRSIPPDVDPKEPFNSIFEVAGFKRAVAVCREFPDLLRPKESYSEKVVKTTQLVLNYCLRNSLADQKYIQNGNVDKDLVVSDLNSRQSSSKESEQVLESGVGSEVEVEVEVETGSGSGSGSGPGPGPEVETVSVAETGPVSEVVPEAGIETEIGSESQPEPRAEASNDTGSEEREPKQGLGKSGSSNEGEACVEKGSSKRRSVFRDELPDETDKSKRPNLYANDKGRTGRKISVRGLSESSDSSEEASPRPKDSERSGGDQQSSAKVEPGKRGSSGPVAGMSRQYRRWSEEETSMLVDGVNKFGLGKWRAILVTTKLTNRDEVGLKDRWRNLVKGGHVTWDSQSKRYRLVK
ncbi:SANT DNA-binding domain-containing telomeric DNA binding protein, partial [Cryptosporidium canis]